MKFGRFPDEFLSKPPGVQVAVKAMFVDWFRDKSEAKGWRACLT